MAQSFYRQAKFLISVANLSQLPDDEGYEVAFVGRSNAGKSSALNVLTHQKDLAYTSKTPGRTQLINLFELDDERRLVDLPGYGYAKVSHQTKDSWAVLIDDYLRERHCLKGIVILIDIRHPWQHFDQQILDWAGIVNLPVHILLTKADKLNFGPRKSEFLKISSKIKLLAGDIDIQLFSALTKEGVEVLSDKLDKWFAI